MIYLSIVLLVVSLFNLAIAFSCLRRLSALELTIDVQQIRAQQNENNVQNILNDRLLELQSKKYALQRIKP
jgi:hypothetical protein